MTSTHSALPHGSRRAGSTAPENLALLILVLLVAVGAIAATRHARLAALAPLARVRPVPSSAGRAGSAPDHGVPDPAASAVRPESDSRERVVVTSAARAGAVWFYVVLPLAGAVGAWLGWKGLRRARRRRNLLAMEDDTVEDPTSLQVDSRVYTKRHDLLQVLLRDPEVLVRNELEVRHLMTQELVTVGPNTPVDDVIAEMTERRVRHVLVCSTRGEVLGMISHADLGRRPGDTARQIMSSPVITVTPETPLGPAITYLVRKHISCLPVVRDGQLIGVLTTTDLVLALQCSLQMWLHLARNAQDDGTPAMAAILGLDVPDDLETDIPAQAGMTH